MNSNSSPYLPLFENLAALAQTQGERSYGPRDHTFEPGNDGTLQPDAHFAKAFMSQYTYAEAQLPLTVQGTEFDHIGVAYYTAAVVGGQIHPESIFVEARETSGIQHTFTLQRALGEITTAKSTEFALDDEAEATEDVSAESPYDTPLTDGEREAIIMALFNGDYGLVAQEGPAGDFARAVHIRLSTPDPELSPDDLEMLHALYDVIRSA